MANFKFRKHMSLGNLSAEHDSLLREAFLDTGDLACILDLSDPHCVVVGRTGTGKSALLEMVRERQPHRTLVLRPESLSLQYLEGSTIIPALNRMGVRLNFFWALFWRHIVTLELIQRHYHIDSALDQESFFQRILRRNNRKNERREAALAYLKDWGGEFWTSSDVRTQKLFQTLEGTIKANAGLDLSPVKVGREDATREQRSTEAEVVQRAQEAVNKIQFRYLEDVLSILKEDVLDDPQKPYYLIIDDLDREWVEAAYVYDLIDALIEEAGTIQRLGNIKMVIALRENILAQVNSRLAGKRGRQREKHEGLLLKIRWNRSDLVQMMNQRIGYLMRGEFGEKATMHRILPQEPHRGRRTGAAVDYMLERTIQRPRDLIKFFNYCIAEADGRGRIEWQHIFAAEKKYSLSQVTALVDEWAENYPDIESVLDTLRELPLSFTAAEFGDDRIVRLVTLGERDTRQGSISKSFYEFWNAMGVSDEPLRRFVLSILYRLCVVGVKLGPTEPLKYYYQDPELLDGPVPAGERYQFHPAFVYGLGIQTQPPADK